MRIDGTYTLLPDCDSACSSLHRRFPPDPHQQQKHQHPHSTPPDNDTLFFFLAPTSIQKADQDCYVISTHHGRVKHDEYRPRVLSFPAGWTPDKAFRNCGNGIDGSGGHSGNSELELA